MLSKRVCSEMRQNASTHVSNCVCYYLVVDVNSEREHLRRLHNSMPLVIIPSVLDFAFQQYLLLLRK